MPRLLHLLFRRKLLFSLPIIVGLVLGVLWTTSHDRRSFQGAATLWVERPTVATGSSFTDYNQYATPSQNQASAMRELMSTRSFRIRVLERLKRSGEASLAVALLTLEDIRAKTYFRSAGAHVLSISHENDSAAVSVDVVRAVLDEYTSLYLAQIQERALTSKQFYEEQLNFARTSLEVAAAQLKEYVATRPQLLITGPINPTALPTGNLTVTSVGTLSLAGVTDQTLLRLLTVEETARKDYEQIQGRYADSQIAAVAADRGTPNFRILDEPQLAERPSLPGKRDLIMKPMFGIMFGVFVSAGMFILSWRLDRSVWMPSDIELIGLNVPIMTLPPVRSPKRSWPKSFVRLAAALRSGVQVARVPETRPVAPEA